MDVLQQLPQLVGGIEAGRVAADERHRPVALRGLDQEEEVVLDGLSEGLERRIRILWRRQGQRDAGDFVEESEAVFGEGKHRRVPVWQVIRQQVRPYFVEGGDAFWYGAEDDGTMLLDDVATLGDSIQVVAVDDDELIGRAGLDGCKMR